MTAVVIAGRDYLDDVLTIDYANGDPIPAGGVNFDGGLLGAGSGNSLALKTTSVDDSAVLTAAQVALNGSTVLTYGNAAFFAFDLGGGTNAILVDHATLRIDRDGAISPGTNVTVNGGLLDFNGHADNLGSLTLIGNGQAGAAALQSTSIAVASGTLTAVSIVCASLTIGLSSSSAACSAPVITLAARDDVPLAVAGDLSTELPGDNAKADSAPIGRAAEVAQPLPGEAASSIVSAVATASVPLVVKAPRWVPSALLVESEAVSISEIASVVRIPDEPASPRDSQGSEPFALDESLAWVLAVNENPTARWNEQRERILSLSSFSQPIARPQESVEEELIVALIKKKKRSAGMATSDRDAHDLALQSVMLEFPHNTPLDEDCEARLDVSFGRLEAPSFKPVVSTKGT